MKLTEIKNLFVSGEIDKHTYISKMYYYHLILKEYSDFIGDSGISKIEISTDSLIFISRETEYHPGGLNFIISIDDKRVTPLEAFNFGRYEDEDSEMIYKLLEDNFTVFDVGANIGWYTTHIAKILTNGSIHAFEPIPDTFGWLKKNTELNYLNNITLNNIALSEVKGEFTFYYSHNMTGASSLQNITNNEKAILVKCKTETLDNYFKDSNLEKLDFIKCDVEGAELFVFKGGIQTILSHKPIVFTEMLRKWSAKFNYHPNEIIKLFTSIGYCCFYNNQGKLKKLNQIDENTVETNFFFLHVDKHADKISILS